MDKENVCIYNKILLSNKNNNAICSNKNGSRDGHTKWSNSDREWQIPYDFTYVGSEVKFAQWCPTLCNPMDYTVHGILQARTLEWVAFPFSRGSSQPRDKTQVPHITGRSLPAEPQGKPENTGVGSLSLLQRIVPTQELNRGSPDCRQVLYQLSSQGSPMG